MQPKLIIEQKITAFVNKYQIFQAQSDGSKGQLVAQAQQKRIAFKEKVTFYTDESKSQIAFTFRAEKVIDVHGRYFVEDVDGNLLGSFKKEFVKSLVNSSWTVFNQTDGARFAISESNQVLAALRRYAGYLPIIGDIFEIVLLFFRYHFNFTDITTNQVVGMYKKTTLFRDHYLLSMNDEVYSQEDWRVLAAMAVGLDALQSR